MKKNYLSLLVFLIVFLSELSWGYYSAVIMDYIPGDSISRVANAFYVLHSRDPHLGAIGFIWNPLPSLLELIPLLFWRIAPIMATAGFASVIVSSFFAAATASLIYHYLKKYNLPLFFRILVTFGFACNPFIFMYGANGMSEMMFAFFVAWSVISFTEWMRKGETGSLVQLGLSLAASFWIRYESVALGASLTISMLLILFVKRNKSDHFPNKRSVTFQRMEAILFIVLTPAIFSGLTWMLLNFTIMGDALYFYRSGYSNLAFVQDRGSELMSMNGNHLAVLKFVMRKSIYFSIPLAGILVLRLFTMRWKRWDIIALLIIAASITAMQYEMLIKGSSYGWMRFFMYPFIVTIAWLPYEWSELRKKAFAKLQMTLLCIGLLLSSFILRDMNNVALSPEDYGALHMSESSAAADMRKFRQIAQYLDNIVRKQPNTLILADSFGAFPIILNTHFPHHLVITNDRDFKASLDSPEQHGIQYILVSNSKTAVLQVITEKYPDLYEKGASWAQLVKDFNGEWRLYRVLPK